jgi:HK97 family phage major capsid protein
MSGVPTNRTNITLPADVSQEIMQKTQGASAVMRLAQQIALPGRGVQIPVITSDPAAAWVGETEAKPVSNPGLSSKLMQAYKLAVIMPFSNEFRRDARSLYDALVARLPGALALKFDNTVLGGTAAPGDNWDNFAACTSQSLVASVGHTAYNALVAAFADIADHMGSLNGSALSPTAEGLLLAATDGQGRPLFVNSAADGAIPRILSAPVVSSRGMYKAGTSGTSGTPALVGVAGDWTQAMYGTVEGGQIGISDQASLKQGTTEINLWQQNMFAVRAEIEIGFRADTNCFNLLVGAIPQA